MRRGPCAQSHRTSMLSAPTGCQARLIFSHAVQGLRLDKRLIDSYSHHSNEINCSYLLIFAAID